MPTRPPDPITRPCLTVVIQSAQPGEESRLDAQGLSWLVDSDSPTGWSLVFACSGALTTVHSHLVLRVEVDGHKPGERGAYWCASCDQPLQSCPTA